MKLIPLVLVGCTIGVVALLVRCHKLSRMPGVHDLLEVVFYSGLTVCGLHLIFCAWQPAALVHLTNEAGQVIHPEGVSVELGELHTIDLFAAGITIACVGVSGILRCWPRVSGDPPTQSGQ